MNVRSLAKGLGILGLVAAIGAGCSGSPSLGGGSGGSDHTIVVDGKSLTQNITLPNGLRAGDVSIGVKISGPNINPPIYVEVPWNPDGPTSQTLVEDVPSGPALFDVLLFAAVCPISHPSIGGCSTIPPEGLIDEFENYFSPEPVETYIGRRRVELEGGEQDVRINLDETPLESVYNLGQQGVQVPPGGQPVMFPQGYGDVINVYSGTQGNPGVLLRGVRVRVRDHLTHTPMPFHEGLVTDHAECWDYYNNDGDGGTDFPQDGNCWHPMDPDESPLMQPPQTPPWAELRDFPVDRRLDLVASIPRLGVSQTIPIEEPYGNNNHDIYLGLNQNHGLVMGRFFLPSCIGPLRNCIPAANMEVQLIQVPGGSVVQSSHTDDLGFFFFSGDFSGMGKAQGCPIPTGNPGTTPFPHSFLPAPCWGMPNGGGVLDWGDLSWISGFSGSGGPPVD